MEGGTSLITLVAALFLAAGFFAAPQLMDVWRPAPRPFIERVLLVGGDLLVDVRNPSDRPLACTVYNAGVALQGPAVIPPGKVATYTGSASGRDVVADCTSGDSSGRGVSIAHQVAGASQGVRVGNGGGGDAGGQAGSQGGGGNQAGGSWSGNGGGSQGGGPELRNFSCEVRRVGNRQVVRLHANIQAVINHGVKPYNFMVDFGDGTVETSIQDGSAYTTNHVYSGAGPYTARLTVTDALGRSVESTLEVPGGCRNA